MQSLAVVGRLRRLVLLEICGAFTATYATAAGGGTRSTVAQGGAASWPVRAFAASNAEPVILKTDLVLGMFQSGFAGETGQQWTVLRSGGVRVSQVRDAVPYATSDGATLSPDRMAQLREAIERSHWSDIPAAMGLRSPVNGARLRISYADKSAQMFLPAGTLTAGSLSARAADAAGPHERALIELAATLLSLLAH